jgi:hypothetical protein
MGQFVEGNPGGPGRPLGSRNAFPRGTKEALKEMIEGRILKDGKAAAEILAELIFKGMNGEIVISQSERGTTYANPLGFAKLYTEYMLKSETLEAAKAKEKGTGGGGIRIVLPNPIADPLLRPGQKPRPLRLLGQDPSKPLPDATGTATDAQPSPGPVPRWCKETRKHLVDTPGHNVAVSAAQSTAVPCPCAKLRRRFRSRRADRGLRAPDLPDLHGDRDGQGRERHQHSHVRLLRGRGPGAHPGVGLDRRVTPRRTPGLPRTRFPPSRL